MKYFFRYVRALYKHRKHIREMVDTYLKSTGDLFKIEDLVKDFDPIMKYEPKTRITAEDFKGYLEGKVDIAKTIKEKLT